MRTAGEGNVSNLAYPLLVAGVAWLVFVLGREDGTTNVGARIVSLVLTLAVLGAWAMAARRDSRWRSASRLWPAFAVGLAAIAIGTVTSRNGRVSQDFLAYAVILASLYLLLRQLLTDERLRQRMGAIVVVVTFTVAIGYLLAVLGRWVTWWGLVGALAVPPLGPSGESLGYGSPGTVAAVVVMGLAISAAHLGVDTRRARGVVSGLAALVLAAVIVTGSHASWIALVIALAVIAAVITGQARGTETGERTGRILRRRSTRRVVAAAAIVVMGLAVAWGPQVLAGLATGGVAAERTSISVVSTRMFLASPMTGSGPGMWAAQRIRNTAPPEIDVYARDAGNLLLQTAAELGVVGLVAGALALASLVVLVRRALRDAEPLRRRWGWAAVAVTTYFAAHQLLELVTGLPSALFLLALPIAWLDASDEGPLIRLPRVNRRIRTAAQATGLTVAVVAALAAGLGERSAIAMGQAQASIEANDWAAALAPLVSADAIDPSIPATLLPLGLAQARTGDRQASLATFTRLTEAEDLPVAWIDRAGLEAIAGDEVAARRSLERGLRLGDQQPQLAFAAGWIYEQLQDIEASNRWYATALVLEPKLARDPFWRSKVRAPRWEGIRAAALERLEPARRVDLWISAGDLDMARDAVRRLPEGDERTLLERVIGARAGDPQARRDLEAWTGDNPSSLPAVTWSARVAAAADDPAGAQRYRDWAGILRPGAAEAGFEVAIELPPISTAPKTGVSSVAWGLYAYRRPTPRDQILSDLPHLALVP